MDEKEKNHIQKQLVIPVYLKKSDSCLKTDLIQLYNQPRHNLKGVQMES